MKTALLLLLLLLACSSAHADGGRLRFSTVSGPFLITLFTSPEPLIPGPADFSVLVQDARTGDMLPGATVAIDLSQQQDAALIHALASHNIATNKLLQAAELEIPTSGIWILHVAVRDGARFSSLDQAVQVQTGSRKRQLVWIFGTLPFAAILLFVAHQGQKAHLAAKRALLKTPADA